MEINKSPLHKEQDPRPQKIEVVDIYNGLHQFHYTWIGNIQKILRFGLQPRGQGAVFSTKSPRWVHNRDFRPIEEMIGIVLDIPEKGWKAARRGKIRLDEFKGLILIDTLPQDRQEDWGDPYSVNYVPISDIPVGDEAKQKILDKVKHIRNIYNLLATEFPIYGTTGNLYYPEIKTHQQILDEI